MSSAPILDNKNPDASSVFEQTALLREARRQKGLSLADVPSLCILDPDGDIVRHLRNSGQAKLSDKWPCYHTELYEFTLAGKTAGIIGCAVGAPFAVLVAEELFACGCRMLISLTSAGQINAVGNPPYFVVIDRALRDEGTSYHYVAPETFAEADPHIVKAAMSALTDKRCPPMSGRVGLPMRRFEKRKKQSPQHAPRAYWLWKWKQPRFPRLPAPPTKTFSALHMSRIRERRGSKILTKAKLTAQSMPYVC